MTAIPKSPPLAADSVSMSLSASVAWARAIHHSVIACRGLASHQQLIVQYKFDAAMLAMKRFTDTGGNLHSQFHRVIPVTLG